MTEVPSDAAQAQPQTSDPTQGKSGSLWIIWAFMALLLAYPLSIGPIGMAYKTKPPPDFVVKMYEPLNYLYSHSTVARRTLDWYIGLWTP